MTLQLFYNKQAKRTLPQNIQLQTRIEECIAPKKELSHSKRIFQLWFTFSHHCFPRGGGFDIYSVLAVGDWTVSIQGPSNLETKA